MGMSEDASHRELLSQRLDATAAAMPDALAIVHGDRRLTWRDVQEQSEQIAASFLAAGVTRGDHVALWLPNHPEWLVLWLGAARIGAVVVPVNTRYKPAEAEYVLRKSESTMLFVEDSFLGIDYVSAFRAICPDWDGTSSTKLPDLRHVVRLGDSDKSIDGFGSYSAFLAAGADVPQSDVEAAQDKVSPDDTLIIVFTSGTTGFPKGVVHTHDALRMMTAVTAWLGLDSSDRVLGHLPLFHVAGVFSSFLPALIAGGALVQLDSWDATEALRLVQDEQISVLSGIPTHFIDLLWHPELSSFDTRSLRTGWIGGSAIPAEVVDGAREKLGMKAILPVYGMTETTSTTTLGRPTDSKESLLAGKGVPIGGYEVAVVDPETRTSLDPGQEGEVAVRGYTVMKGYYHEPEATAAVMDDAGWFYTGDLGVFDADGYLAITGRRSDKFIVGGNNVHPADIELVLLKYPGVKQAYIVARPHRRLGEVAVAFVEMDSGIDATADEIKSFCSSSLASFKVPRDVIFVDTWPMTPTGKVQRFRLRELAAAAAETATESASSRS
ncbi:MAG: fatty-acyl-CoA synthase [Frankiales bacterium]|nr:fatty-acyl-CoA synthase [Frankiales bacterium]